MHKLVCYDGNTFSLFSKVMVSSQQYPFIDSASITVEQLAAEIIRVLDVKARQDLCHPQEAWTRFENGNGVEIGQDVEGLIQLARTALQESA